MFNTLGLTQHYEQRTVVSLDEVRSRILVRYKTEWEQGVNQVAKLRTYRTFKHSFESERYLELNLERHELSLLAQTRSGILPLRVETGRYVGERPEERLCTLCDMRQVEDEQHFVLCCPVYNTLRDRHFDQILRSIEFTALSD